jgi:hypothetical protein
MKRITSVTNVLSIIYVGNIYVQNTILSLVVTLRILTLVSKNILESEPFNKELLL